ETGRGPLPERREGDPLQDEAEDSAQRGGEREGERDVHSPLADEGERSEGAEHEHLLVGEVQDVEHAEDERVADGEEGVDASEEDAVDRLLHAVTASPGTSCP